MANKDSPWRTRVWQPKTRKRPVPHDFGPTQWTWTMRVPTASDEFEPDKKQLSLLAQGVESWNKWRKKHPHLHPSLDNADLRRANLRMANLSGADMLGACLEGANLNNANLSRADISDAKLMGAKLRGADLRKANLMDSDFRFADLREANLTGADLIRTDLFRAKLMGADFRGANLFEANLRKADLTGANLSGALLGDTNLQQTRLARANLTDVNLQGARLLSTNFRYALIDRCRVYGISAWNVDLSKTYQRDIVITPSDQPTITVDNLEIAQFIYLLLNNRKLRKVIDTIGRKAVLILGRFTPGRKAVLDAIREKLRACGYVPILFDFEVPASRDITETISTLAHMARFIIADLTEPSSIPKELEAIVPTLAVPVQPLLEKSKKPYAMFKDYWKYPWVLDVHRYKNTGALISSFEGNVIRPAENKAKELEDRRRAAMELK